MWLQSEREAGARQQALQKAAQQLEERAFNIKCMQVRDWWECLRQPRWPHASGCTALNPITPLPQAAQRKDLDRLAQQEAQRAAQKAKYEAAGGTALEKQVGPRNRIRCGGFLLTPLLLPSCGPIITLAAAGRSGP